MLYDRVMRNIQNIHKRIKHMNSSIKARLQRKLRTLSEFSGSQVSGLGSHLQGPGSRVSDPTYKLSSGSHLNGTGSQVLGPTYEMGPGSRFSGPTNNPGSQVLLFRYAVSGGNLSNQFQFFSRSCNTSISRAGYQISISGKKNYTNKNAKNWTYSWCREK